MNGAIVCEECGRRICDCPPDEDDDDYDYGPPVGPLYPKARELEPLFRSQ